MSQNLHHRSIAFWKTLVVLVALHKVGLLAAQDQQQAGQQADLNDHDRISSFPEGGPSRSPIVNLEIHATGQVKGEHDTYAPKDMFESSDQEADKSVVKRTPESNTYPGKDSIILIATVDGTLTGVSKRTGEVLWKQGPNPPRHSYRMKPMDSKTPEAPRHDVLPLLDPWVSTSSIASRHHESKITAIPSIIDGKVYLTTASAPQSDTFLHEEEEVTALIEDLVKRAPFVDRGRLFTATRDTTVCAVDTKTGAVHQQVPVLEPNGNDEDTDGEKEWIWLGRVDMAVSIHSPDQPDVRFSYSTLLSAQDMMLSSEIPQPTPGYTLLATPSGQAAFLDWTVSLDHPVAVAMDAGTGRIIPVKMIADLTTGRPFDGDRLKTTTIQGAIKGSGQLFAMPLITNGAPQVVEYSSRAVVAARVGASGEQHHQICEPGSPHFHTCLSKASTSDIVPYRYSVTTDSSTEEAFQVSRRRPSSWQLLGHWLPPLLVFLLVASFEIGRRKRDIENHVIRIDESAILGHGGGGTMVYAGTLHNRKVAVKRMLKTYSASANREISLLIESDGHPNVVRYFLKEVRGDFVYLALELCDLSLHDLIGHIKNHLENKEESREAVLSASKVILAHIVEGVKHLHKLRIVHRDVKPNNFLLASRGTKRSKASVFDTFLNEGYVAKISDMGLGKQLMGHSSYGGASLINEASILRHSSGGASSLVGAGPGSVGWQAPEVMAARNMNSDASAKSEGSENISDLSPLELSPGVRTSRTVDIFSLGCVFYSLLVPGSHPFGEWYEREANIMHNKPNIEVLRELSPEAFDLISSMLRRTAAKRPTASQVGSHLFFWADEQKLNFLCDFSDRIESDATTSVDAVNTKSIVLLVERNAARVVGNAWDCQIDDDLVSNVQRFRSYDPSSVRDLLRLLRNKHHHYDELSNQLKNRIGTKTSGMMKYFERRFPRLALHCYQACQEMYHDQDPLMQKYKIPSRISTKNPDPSDVIEEEQIDEHFVMVEDVEVPALAPVVEEEPCGLAATADAAASIEKTSETAMEECGPIDDLIVWNGSSAASAFQCRGWNRSDEEWVRNGKTIGAKRSDSMLIRCAEDPKFRTRLCNHWDVSKGTYCPMRKKNKCIFAHSAVELRVKAPKRHRWGKLVDKDGNHKNPNASGGEDTLGAAKAIEFERKQEGKWNTDRNASQRATKSPPKKM